MRLPNFLDDPDLNALRAQMGAAELGSFRLSVNPYRFTVRELEQLIVDGIEVKYLDEVRPLEDRTLSYKDRRVLLYTRDAPDHFHFSNCPTVRGMRERGGSGRHAVSAREDGNFKVDVVLGNQVQSMLRRLPVCEACLSELSFDNFSENLPPTDRVRALAGFTVTRFFEKYRRNLLPDSTDGAGDTARLQKLPPQALRRD
jgi:hypothetical protein